MCFSLSLSQHPHTVSLLSSISMYPCRSFCVSVIAECNQMRWSAWRRHSLALHKPGSKPRRGRESTASNLSYMQTVPLQKWRPCFTSEPLGQREFIANFPSHIHWLIPYISHLSVFLTGYIFLSICLSPISSGVLLLLYLSHFLWYFCILVMKTLDI